MAPLLALLQSHPLRENFCRYPTRSPFEYAKLSVVQANSATAPLMSRIAPPIQKDHRDRRGAGASIRWY